MTQFRVLTLSLLLCFPFLLNLTFRPVVLKPGVTWKSLEGFKSLATGTDPDSDLSISRGAQALWL